MYTDLQNFSFKNNKLLIIFLCLTVLFILNLVIFWNHYFNEMGFPLDFSHSYYGRIALASTLISQGVFPQWIPFQEMGYPLSMDPHFTHSMFYPFFWIFSVLGIQYTLQNAVILQSLHIFMGSVGMFFFLNYMFKSYRYALLGAIAFSFFGGFYSNAPYPDMIIAFAISPWMFYVFTLNIDRPALRRVVLFIPIVIFVFTNGSYPGHFVAGIFMITLFIILQTLNGFRLGIGKQKSFFIGIVLIGLMILGLSVSMIYLGPFLQYGDELKRLDEDYVQKKQNVFQNENFHQSFLGIVIYDSTEFTAGLYLGLPILVFASFVPLPSLKKYWVFLMLLIIATLMVIENSFFYQIMTSIIPPLGYSIRTIAEYGAFIAIPIFVFAIIGLKAIVERKVTKKTFLIRTAFISTWFSYGIFLLFSNHRIWKDHGTDSVVQILLTNIIILVVLIFFIAFFFIRSKNFNLSSIKKPFGLSFIVLVFFVPLILVDGFTAISDNPKWRLDPSDAYYKEFDFSLEKNGKLVTYGILENLPDKRPERELLFRHEVFAWKGSLEGSYILGDVSTPILQSSRVILGNQIYWNFMQHPWTPLLTDFSIDENETEITLPASIFQSIGNFDTFEKTKIAKINQTSVIQTHYGIDDISYKVSLDEPKLMVENEIYFPGWTATLVFPDHEEKLQAIEVNDLFRAWSLPAGEYEMNANFQYPNFVTFQIISLGAFAMCILIIVVFWRKLEGSKLDKDIPKHPSREFF